MKNVFYANPIIEAMFYYAGKINGSPVSKRLADMAAKYPESKKLIEKAARPAAALEKLLDSKLKVNGDAAVKFFRKFDSRKAKIPFGFCLASVMIYFPLITHLNLRTDEFNKYLHERSENERLCAFIFGIADDCEPVCPDKNKLSELSGRIDRLMISFENKWKLMNAFIDYDSHINELFSLIIPAVKIINAAELKFKAEIDEFRLSCPDANIEKIFAGCLPVYDTMNIVPTVLGFDDLAYISTVSSDSDASEPSDGAFSDAAGTAPFTNIIIGTARYIVRNSPREKISELSQKLKTLSDNTRLEILFWLCSHRSYGQELCKIFKIQHSTVSYHITKLKAAGLLCEEMSAGKVYYSADRSGIEQMVNSFIDKIKQND